MYKLVSLLLVVYIVIALYSLTFNSDISMYSLLENLESANWRDFPMSNVQKIINAFKDIKLNDLSWKDVFTTWKLFQKMGNLVNSGFDIFTGLIKLFQELFKFIFLNIAEFFKVMFNFLKPNTAD